MDLTLIFAILIAAILFSIITIYCRSTETSDPNNDLPQSLLASVFHEDSLPLTRQDVERGWTDIERWICGICEFTNSSIQNYCALCGTDKEFRCSLGESTYIKKGSMISSGCIPLNSRQKLARQRNEWRRIRKDDGKWRWQRVKNIKQYEQDEKKKYENEDGIILKRQESDVEEGLVTRLTLGCCHDDSTCCNSNCNGNGRLTLTKTDLVNAALSTSGYEITIEDLKTLTFLSSLPFHQKYGWFVEQTTDLMKPWEDGRLKLHIRRENVLVDSMEQLLGIKMEHIHMPLRIEFVNEHGIDAGGLEREWFSLLAEKIFNENIGLFKCCSNEEKTFMLNPSSRDVSIDHLLYYKGTGRFIGRALLEGHHLPTHLCLPTLKHILGIPLTFKDLIYLDPEVYKSMMWIKNNSQVDMLELDFSIMERNYDRIEIVDLKPNGRNICVTDENKMEYLCLRFKYLVLTCYEKQLQSFMEGLFQVIPQELLLVFDFQELDLILCGIPNIDVEDWKKHTVITDLLIGSIVVNWFWEIVECMSDIEKSRLLQFITGSGRVPLQGFQALTSYDGRICPFTMKGIEYSNAAYPKAHTCFNRIDIPIYKKKEELHQVMHLVINMEITGFTDE